MVVQWLCNGCAFWCFGKGSKGGTFAVFSPENGEKNGVKGVLLQVEKYRKY